MDCELQDCSGPKHVGAFACLHKPVLHEAKRRLQQYYRDVNRPDPNSYSLLSSMLQRTNEVAHYHNDLVGKGEALRVTEVVSNAISFMAAGWETSTLTMVNTLWPLTAWDVLPASEQHQVRVAKEATAGHKGGSELAGKLLAETLRWRPPVPWHAGNTLKDLDVEAHGLRYSIPAGTRLIADILSVNHLPPAGLVAGWDPEATRMAASERVDEHAAGLGSRHCPGGKVARHGMVIVLSALLHKWVLRLSSSGGDYLSDNVDWVSNVTSMQSPFDGWLQAYSGLFQSDLCNVLFRTPLWVHVLPRSGV